MFDSLFIPPALRPDGGPLHENPVRRFREELRLEREQFCRLLNDLPVATLRGWEEPFDSKHYHAPRSYHVDMLVALAQRNRYPLFMEHVTPPLGHNLVVQLKVGSRATLEEVAQARLSLLELVTRKR
jgi:hypothetical protein